MNIFESSLWVNGDREDKIAFILIAVCESVLPDLLDFASGYPAV